VEVNHFDNLSTKQQVEETHFDNLSNEAPVEITRFDNIFFEEPVWFNIKGLTTNDLIEIMTDNDLFQPKWILVTDS
jgi:uncharacterized protein YqkB